MSYNRRHRKDATHKPIVKTLIADGCLVGDVSGVDRFFDLLVAVPITHGGRLTTSVLVLVELKRTDWKPENREELARDIDQRARATEWRQRGVCVVRTDNAQDIVHEAERWYAGVTMMST